jgi:hypothetical protein
VPVIERRLAADAEVWLAAGGAAAAVGPVEERRAEDEEVGAAKEGRPGLEAEAEKSAASAALISAFGLNTNFDGVLARY